MARGNDGWIDYDPDILARAARARASASVRREGTRLMVSNIDPSVPSGPNAYTADVRDNFAAAKAEIEALQTPSPGSGGVTKIDRSGAIALAGQAQQLMAANSDRRGWSFQNRSGANLYFDDLGGTADPVANSSTYLPPGAYYESEPGGSSIAAISLIGDVTGASFAAKEW